MRKLKNKRIYQLFTLMIVGLLIVTITSIFIIYKTVYNEKKSLLHEVCINQKEVIQSIYGQSKSKDVVLDVLVHQRRISEGLGTTGEFTIGFRRNDSIIFLIKSRQNAEFMQSSIPIKSNLGKPMQFALTNQSDFVRGLDYQGNMVLSYVTYIPELKWGLVTKMDIAEVRLPFYKTTLIAIISSIILILIATFLFIKISRSVVNKIADSEENYHLLFEYSAIPIWKEDFSEVKKYVDQLKQSGNTDLRTYFSDHQNEINNIMSLIKVIEINQQSVVFFKADSKEQLIENRHYLYTEAFLDVCKEGIVLMADGILEFEREIQLKIMTGETKFLVLHLRVVKGYENTLSNVLISFIDITERKRAEAEIQKNIRLLEDIIDGSPSPIFLKDREGRFITINSSLEKMLGMSRQELNGKTDYDIAPKEAADIWKENDTRVIDGQPIQLEEEADLMDGHHIFLANKFPLKDSQGQIYGIGSISHDITARKKVEEALAKMSKLLSESQKIAHLGSFEYIAAIQTTVWSEEEFRIYGLDPAGPSPEYEELLKNHIHPDDAQLLNDTFAAAMSSKSVYELEHRIVRPDGSVRHVYDLAHPYFDSNGELVRYVGATLDITDRKNAEEKLLMSESRLRRFYDSGLIGIIFWNNEGIITDANDKFLEMVGYTRDDLKTGKIDWVNMTPPEYRHLDEETIKELYETGFQKTPFEKEYIHKNGMRIPIIISGAFLYNDKINGVAIVLDITERKKAEEALRKSEEQLRLSQKASGAGAWDWDIPKNELNWAPEFFELMGLDATKHSASFETWQAILHPDDLEMAQKRIEESLANHSLLDNEYRIIRPDGKTQWIYALGNTISDKDNKPMRMSGICIDITERKQAEAEMMQLNRTLKALGESSQAMMYSREESEYLNSVCRIIVEKCGHLMAWIGIARMDDFKSVEPVASFGNDDGYTKLLNISWADTPYGQGPTGTAIRTCVPVVCRNIATDPNFTPWRSEALKRGFASSVVIPLIDEVRAIGSINIYSAEADPFSKHEIDLLTDIAADVVHGIKTIRLRQSEAEALEKLTSSENKLWSVLHATQESIYMFDREGKYLIANQKGLKRLGTEKSTAIMGHHFSEFMTPEQAELQQTMIKKLMKTCKPVEFDHEHNGKVFHHNYFPVFERGEISYIVAYSADITQRIKFETILQLKNTELEKSNATKNRFFSIIAHDMKNPFISLLGTSELLNENALRYDKQRIIELAKILSDSAKNGYDTLLNLLGWASSQAGSLIFVPEKINLKSLIHRNLANLTETASSKQIKLTFHIDEHIQLFADTNMLNAILRNLINNAIKFTPRGGAISVGTKSENNALVIFIKDNGVGIDSFDIENLFRSDISHSKPGTEYESGTGLGLPLCKEFVEKHGGKIWVESEVNKGSTFYFSLPDAGNTNTE